VPTPTPSTPDDGASTPAGNDRPALSDRERNILRLVVNHFIDTAGPVGSRSLAKKYELDLSPASIRNTMADLEDMGYLDHPYTSAGRVPTRLGYRTFVDYLMDRPSLDPAERQVLKEKLARLVRDTDELLRESARLLSKLTSLLGIALTPRLSTGVLERLDIVPLTGSRLLFVLSVKGGLVKTIVIDFAADVRRSELSRVVSILNERLAGLTLREIRETHDERIRDVQDSTGIIDRIRDEAAFIFSEPTEERLRLGGTQNILRQPEFQEPDDVRQLIEMIEDEHRVITLLDNLMDTNGDRMGGVSVRIGDENEDAQLDAYSIVTSPYRFGDTVGTLGVIGPTRMDYGRAVALVKSMADVLNKPPSSELPSPPS
jgi:heat-inducible transcriptional repressor